METIKQGTVILKSHLQFDSFQFVIKALCKDESRPTLTHLLAQEIEEDVYYVATDGRRLHLFSFNKELFPNDEFNEVLEAGLYELISKSSKAICLVKAGEESEKDMKYPDWQQLISIDQDWPSEKTTVDCTDYGKLMTKTLNVFNVNYLKDATGVEIVKRQSVYYEFDQGKLILKHELGQAVVMPFRDEDEEEGKPQEREASNDEPDLPNVD